MKIRNSSTVMPEEHLRFKVDLGARLSRYDMVWGPPAGPPASWREGAPIGNGDFGALIYGYPDNLSFVLGKTDLWDRSVRKSFLKGGSFEKIRRIYQTGDRKAFEELAGPRAAPPRRQHATTAGMFRLHIRDTGVAISPILRVSRFSLKKPWRTIFCLPNWP